MIVRPSKASRLPAEIRDKIAALRAEGCAIEEILAHLRRLDLPPDALPTRSGLYRYTKRLDIRTAEAARTRAIVGALIDKLGELPKSRQAQLNIELLQMFVTGVAAAAVAGDEDGNALPLAPEQVYTLAMRLESLVRSQRNHLDATPLARNEELAEIVLPWVERRVAVTE